MNKVQLNKDILDTTPIYRGFESNIYKEKNILYKIFKTQSYDVITNKIEKLKILNDIPGLDKCFISMPINSLMLKDKYIGYSRQDEPEYKKLDSFDNNTSKKIAHLKRIKDVLKILHKHNIIYGDLSLSNIFEKNGNVRFFEYDNVCVDGLSFDQTNYCEELYIKEFGIDETLDTYMYNLLVISYLTSVVEAYAIDYIKTKGLPDVIDNIYNKDIIQAMINLDDSRKIKPFVLKEKRYHLL